MSELWVQKITNTPLAMTDAIFKALQAKLMMEMFDKISAIITNSTRFFVLLFDVFALSLCESCCNLSSKVPHLTPGNLCQEIRQSQLNKNKKYGTISKILIFQFCPNCSQDSYPLNSLRVPCSISQSLCSIWKNTSWEKTIINAFSKEDRGTPGTCMHVTICFEK